MSEQPAVSGPVDFAASASRMMTGGILGAHLSLVLAVVVGAVSGTHAVISVLISGLTVSVLTVLGQMLQIKLVQRADLTGFAGVLAGFGLRAGALLAGLGLWLNVGSPVIVAWAVALGGCAVTIGWLAGVLVVYRRLHIPVFDPDAATPASVDQTDTETNMSETSDKDSRQDDQSGGSC